MPVSLHLLNHLLLLRPLQAEEMADLSAHMQIKQFARRAMVLDKQSSAGELGFLLEGRLQGVDFTVEGRSVGLYFVEPGDYFGELAVLDEKAPSEFVVAAARSTVAFLDGPRAREMILQHPQIAKSVMLRMAARIRTVLAQRTLLSIANPFQRLCALLLQLPHVTNGPGAREIQQVPTHQELAIMINASRETVTRGFQLLFTHEAISREGDTLRINNAQFIQDTAEGRTTAPRP